MINIQLSQKKVIILIVSTTILFLIFTALTILSITSNNKNPTANFKITSLTPKDGESNIFPGEIQITFTTDVPINREDYDLFIEPTPNLPTKITNSFPTTQITHQVLGGLSKDTEYKITAINKHNKRETVWTFTTSNQQQESSPELLIEDQKNLNDNFFPLFEVLPYENKDFQIDYSGKLQLIVKIKKNKVDDIKKEVLEWIRTQGVDPSTHTINYENAF